MKTLMLFVFLAAACTAEFSTEETEEDVPNDEGGQKEVLEQEEVLEIEDMLQEVTDALQELDAAEAGEIIGEDKNGEEEAIEDSEDVPEEDSVADGFGEDILEDTPDEAGDEPDLEILEEDDEEELEPCGGCPEGFICCGFTPEDCVELGTVENCLDCSDVCEDEDGDSCMVPICGEEGCGMEDGCEEGYRCYGGICAKECSRDEDCVDRCMEGEYCHSLGVCIGGSAVDCSDLYPETVDDCFDWENAPDGDEACCHICDYWHRDCRPQAPVWDGGHLVHANSFSGTFKLLEPAEIFTGHCKLTHIKLITNDPWISGQLIDEDVGIIAVLDARDPRDALNLWHEGRTNPILVGYWWDSGGNENAFADIGYNNSTLLSTDNPECLFKVDSLSLGPACKVCNPGAGVPEYAGCPW